MPLAQNSYQLLIQKLDQFIRKYYLNSLLRGAIYTGALLLALFLVVNLTEYYLYLPVWGRKVAFYGFIIATLGVLYAWVITPLMHYYSLGRLISYEQAADIIGKHFSDVEDRLLNILQLHGQRASLADASLIQASIDQKIENLRPIPFTSAIDLSSNRKYLRYLIVPVLALLLIVFGAPNIIKDGTTRILNNSTQFEKPAPFVFELINNELEVVQYEDFELEVKIKGELIPAEVYVRQGNYNYRMSKAESGGFKYTFANVQKDIPFNLYAGPVQSKEYVLNVLPKPMIVGFEVSLDYPVYTGKEDESLKNIGDLSVPQGTKVQWRFDTRNTEHISMLFEDTAVSAGRRGDKLFDYTGTLMKSTNYTLKVSNAELPDGDSISYSIAVAPDQYPSIQLQAFEDSVSNQYLYFLGEVGDDYGLTRLNISYKVSREGAREGAYTYVPVNFNRQERQSKFTHLWNLADLNLKPGDELVYYFEVWDNDAINGSKSSRSAKMAFKMPTEDELKEQTAQSNEAIKDKLEASVKKAEEVRDKMKDVQERLMEKKNLNWEDKKAIQDLLEQQKALEEDVQDLQQEMGENIARQEQYKDISSEVAEKQKKLQELFNNVLSDEMKEMFRKMESMLEELNKENALEEMKDMELSEEQLSEELDRMLSLFKQLEFEQKMNETIDELSKLAQEQADLKEQTESKNKDNESLTKEQEELNEKFDKVKEDLAQLEEMQEELGHDMPLEDMEKSGEQISEQMKQSSESLKQGKPQKATQNQQKASDEMQEMSEQLSQMMQSMQMEQMQLDMQAVRQLLENLIRLSFDQEQLMDDIQSASVNDPSYVPMVQRQYKLKDDAEMVKDSLFALSKRAFQMETFINDEIRNINKNIGNSIEQLEARKKNEAGVSQQYTMTGFNNLALMLSEVMEQMQQQMASEMAGSQMCQKPGGGGKPKPSMGMGQLQEQLNKQMESLMKGKSPGGKEGGMSKELAEMAAKQAALRKALQEMDQKENGDGSLGNLKEVIKQMDKTETDLVNKQLTTEMLKRQQEIHTRLLEAETAMREREVDKKRKSQTGEEIVRKMPPSLEEYFKQRDAEIQLYRTVPPSLSPYYRDLVETYFKNISF